MTLVKEQRLVVLKADGGVPYNFKVTPATRIEIGGKKAGFEDLDAMTNANVSVTFVPMSDPRSHPRCRPGRRSRFRLWRTASPVACGEDP
jgi:hypothetical protein